ncbi:MAG TPA: CoA-acylating methylmalonate-semialdehyde dehydrogenase [Gemmatimonadales bacterium]|nr:CoA-acylating methylmalonate-semialdehyde dehydrogenase [Gemmatimonadales bacterium]
MPIPNFVAGRWTKATASESLPLSNPATGESLGRVPLSTREDTAAAIAAAARAFPSWRDVPAVERIQVLFRLKALLEGRLDELAELMTREHGKTREESAGELKRGIESITHACAIPTLLMGETLENIAPGIDCETIRQPLGVFAVVTPYNFPVMIPLWFWPFAIATGNTVVLKPSERDPLTHQRVIDLVAEAGLPAGVLNVVHGDQHAVDVLLEHPDIQGVSFVGSSPVARSIYSKAAAAGKRVQALGGAKNHMIVLPDADVEATARAVVASVYGAAGQRCLAGSVIVGVGEAYRPIRDSILKGAAALKLGYGLDAGVTMGPVISAPHRARIAGYVEQGERDGAKLLLDGRTASVSAYPSGHWFGPTVFEGVTPEMAIGREEIFGPVAGLTRADTLAGAIALVHRNAYGNAISLFTTSGAAAREFRYHAGISMIGVNIGVVAPMAFFPFGGSRGSFYGDLKAQGRDAIEFYTDKRVVISKW